MEIQSFASFAITLGVTIALSLLFSYYSLEIYPMAREYNRKCQELYADIKRKLPDYRDNLIDVTIQISADSSLHDLEKKTIVGDIIYQQSANVGLLSYFVKRGCPEVTKGIFTNEIIPTALLFSIIGIQLYLLATNPTMWHTWLTPVLLVLMMFALVMSIGDLRNRKEKIEALKSMLEVIAEKRDTLEGFIRQYSKA